MADRPIGPRERAWLDAAEAYERAAKLERAAGMLTGGSYSSEALHTEHRASELRGIAERIARPQDEEAGTWIEWIESGSSAWLAPASRNVVANYNLSRLDGVWTAKLGNRIIGRGTLDEAKQACEDHARRRGRFAPEDSADAAREDG